MIGYTSVSVLLVYIEGWTGGARGGILRVPVTIRFHTQLTGGGGGKKNPFPSLCEEGG